MDNPFSRYEIDTLFPYTYNIYYACMYKMNKIKLKNNYLTI